MTPACFGSNRTHCKSEAMAKADMGQGFKDPERDKASSSTFPLQRCQHLHTAHKALSSKSSTNLALRSPCPAQAACLGDPPVPSYHSLTTCPCISEHHRDHWETFLLQLPPLPSPVPPTSRTAGKRFGMTTSSGVWLSNKCQKHGTNVNQTLPRLGESSCRAASADGTRLAPSQSRTLWG